LCLNSRKLKNREKVIPKEEPCMGHPLTLNSQEKMESVHSIKNAIGTYIFLHSPLHLALLSVTYVTYISQYTVVLAPYVVYRLGQNILVCSQIVRYYTVT
jgi:hypothetical protein